MALLLVAICFTIAWMFNFLLRGGSITLYTKVSKCHELLSTTTLDKRVPLNQNLAVAFGIEDGSLQQMRRSITHFENISRQFLGETTTTMLERC